MVIAGATRAFRPHDEHIIQEYELALDGMRLSPGSRCAILSVTPSVLVHTHIVASLTALVLMHTGRCWDSVTHPPAPHQDQEHHDILMALLQGAQGARSFAADG